VNGRAVFRGIASLTLLATLVPHAAGVSQDADETSADVEQTAEDVPAQVFAMLQVRCAECHTPEAEDPKAVRDWDTAEDLAATVEQLVEPGSPDLSDLWLVVDEDEMPPEDSDIGLLTAEERKLLHDWIADGAPLGAFGGGVQETPGGTPDSGGGGTDADVGEESGDAIGQDPGANPGASPGADADEDSSEEAESSRWPEVRAWLGRTHPSMVHFPIALLLAAALAETLVLMGARGLLPAVRFCVILGFLGSAAGAYVGWVLGESASKTLEPELTWHRWVGVGTAALALLLLVVSEIRVRQKGPSPWTARMRWLLLLTAVAVSWAGHLGGILTYGEDYLSLPW